MHRYGIITTLPFSKYASPIFAQQKPNSKLRLLVDLRKINALIADDYINNNHPVSTLSDAAQHLAGKKLFCELDWSQAYHCLQVADRRSVELFAFTFASTTFAYRRLAQGLSRALSPFSSFMREYLDSVIEADQCEQYELTISELRKHNGTANKENQSSFQMHQGSRVKTNYGKMSFWSHPNRISGKNYHPTE